MIKQIQYIIFFNHRIFKLYMNEQIQKVITTNLFNMLDIQSLCSHLLFQNVLFPEFHPAKLTLIKSTDKRLIVNFEEINSEENEVSNDYLKQIK